MAEKTTTSRKYVFLRKYFTFPSYKIHIRNHGPGKARVEVREIFDDNYNLDSGECVNHLVVGYAEVWIKSRDGSRVTVETHAGKCRRRQTDDFAAATEQDEADLPNLDDGQKENLVALRDSLRKKTVDRITNASKLD